jgi:two-component system, chemotaxis family, protein-glutamate methylesterase/glutaminase
MNTAFTVTTPTTVIAKPIRVMVVDDAVVVRRLLTRWIAAEPDMMMVGCARTGREAVEQLESYDPDVVVLDVDMPELDGISALPLLLKKKRDLVVIMASALTRRGAEISLRALSLGAADYIPKPETAPDPSTSIEFHRELIDKIRSLGRRGRFFLRQWKPDGATHPPEPPPRQRAPLPQPEGTAAFTLRPFALSPPRALLIGSSTGGPQALTTLVGQIGATIERAPILITQHMPPTFTTVLAEHLARSSGRRVSEAEHDEPIVAGGIYVAPGGRHMRVVRGPTGPTIALGDDPPVNFCKPSVDPFLSSAAQVWGSSSLALVLTGMGSDGARGAADVAAAGGSVIAQDEETSVVWGMPRSVALAGLCSAILPLCQIAAEVNRLFIGGRP